MRQFSIYRHFISTVIISLFSIVSTAQRNIFISPTRIVFNELSQSKELTVTNRSNEKVRYSLSFVEMRMNNVGKLEHMSAPDSGQLFATPYLNIYPDYIDLDPGESKMITINRKEVIEPGEYRSHLFFKPYDAAAETDTTASKSEALGITMPVIIRQGISDTRVGITRMALTIVNDTPMLQVTLTRIGNMSAYGDITINYQAPDGTAMKLSEIKGLAVYTPNRTRTINLPLKSAAGFNFRSGKLTADYKGNNYSNPDIAAKCDLELH